MPMAPSPLMMMMLVMMIAAELVHLNWYLMSATCNLAVDLMRFAVQNLLFSSNDECPMISLKTDVISIVRYYFLSFEN